MLLEDEGPKAGTSGDGEEYEYVSEKNRTLIQYDIRCVPKHVYEHSGDPGQALLI